MGNKLTSPSTSGARAGRPAATGICLVTLVALGTLSGCSRGPTRAGADWRRSHPGVGRSLVRTVNWPGTTVDRVEGDAHGFRAVLKFAGDDSDMGALAQVEVADADPCQGFPYLVSDTGAYSPDPSTYGDTAFDTALCTPAGANAWNLVDRPHDGDPWYGYAERRDGVLLILSTYDDWTDPDFKAIAGTLHRLDDERLGSLL